jgi:thioredoxin-like negative regulator of GroEL
MEDWSMRYFTSLQSLEDVMHFMKQHNLVFLYISRDDCTVCHSLLPQIQRLMEDYPRIALGIVKADEVQAIAGTFLVFTVPAMLLFVEGKEMIREARFVHMQTLRDKIEQIYLIS